MCIIIKMEMRKAAVHMRVSNGCADALLSGLKTNKKINLTHAGVI